KVNPYLKTMLSIISGLGALLARGEPTRKSGILRLGRDLILAIAPLVFIVGLFIIVIWAVTLLGNHANNFWYWGSSFSAGPGMLLRTRGYWLTALELGSLTLLFTILWSRRVGVNDFSIHALYGNRLIRAYLGASNVPRYAHPFTGFATADNSVNMAALVETPEQKTVSPLHRSTVVTNSAMITRPTR
ncbi:MAG: hypothetical protein P8047_17200, partial [Gammaproteobacteria bacterium]